jgi:hypothetical protein
MMLTQKSKTTELRLLQLLRLKPHQPIPLLQRPLDGTSQLGIAPDPRLLLEILPNSIPALPLITIHHTFQPTMPTQRFKTTELKLPLLLRLKPHQLILPLQRLLDGTSQLGITLDLRLPSEILPNSTLALPLITIHHTFQPTMPIQRFKTTELRLLLLLRLKPHQQILLLQRPLDGTKMPGITLDLRLLSET